MLETKRKYMPWSPEEILLLKELYPKIRVKDLSKNFPHRNKRTIVAKALEMGLPSAKLWHSQNNELLRLYFENSSKEELLKLFPRRSWAAIIAQGERLGLRRKRDKPRLRVNEIYFEKWSNNMAYILGFILADGCIVRGTYEGYSDSLKFGVQLRDIDILEKIKKELESEHAISKVKNAAHLSITSQKLVDSLQKLKISYRKSLNEKIFPIPKQFVKDFIRGVVDGDGSIFFDKRNYPTLSVSGGKNTINFIASHFWNEFKAFSVVGRRTYSNDAKNYLYQISYRANTAKNLILYLYENATLYLDRKYHLAQKCLSIQFRRKQKHEAYSG